MNIMSYSEYLLYWLLLAGTVCLFLYVLFGPDEYAKRKRNFDLDEQIADDYVSGKNFTPLALNDKVIFHPDNSSPSPYLMLPRRSLDEVEHQRQRRKYKGYPHAI